MQRIQIHRKEEKEHTIKNNIYLYSFIDDENNPAEA